MGLRNAYKTATKDVALRPAQQPARSLKVNMADANKVSEALEKQFPMIQPLDKPEANADFVAVLPDPNSSKNLGKVILYKSGSLVLTGALVDFQWPPKA